MTYKRNLLKIKILKIYIDLKKIYYKIIILYYYNIRGDGKKTLGDEITPVKARLYYSIRDMEVIAVIDKNNGIMPTFYYTQVCVRPKRLHIKRT